MAKVTLSKISVTGLHFDVYAPMTADDVEALGGQESIIFDFHKKRSAGNHRRYFAFIKQAFDMQEQFESREIFRKYIEMRAGHFDTVVSPKTGEAMYWPKSVSWEKLDEVEFKRLFNDVIQAFIDFYGHDLTPDQINQMAAF